MAGKPQDPASPLAAEINKAALLASLPFFGEDTIRMGQVGVIGHNDPAIMEGDDE